MARAVGATPAVTDRDAGGSAIVCADGKLVLRHRDTDVGPRSSLDGV